jgi:hypothetical protein
MHINLFIIIGFIIKLVTMVVMMLKNVSHTESPGSVTSEELIITIFDDKDNLYEYITFVVCN